MRETAVTKWKWTSCFEMIPGGKHILGQFQAFSLFYICGANQTLCYPEATFSKKKKERKSWISLQRPVQPPWLPWQLYSKTQTCRNLMLCHRNWYECCTTAPPQRTHTHTHSVSLCFYITHPEFVLSSYPHLFLYQENELQHRQRTILENEFIHIILTLVCSLSWQWVHS